MRAKTITGIDDCLRCLLASQSCQKSFLYHVSSWAGWRHSFAANAFHFTHTTQPCSCTPHTASPSDLHSNSSQFVYWLTLLDFCLPLSVPSVCKASEGAQPSFLRVITERHLGESDSHLQCGDVTVCWGGFLCSLLMILMMHWLFCLHTIELVLIQ